MLQVWGNPISARRAGLGGGKKQRGRINKCSYKSSVIFHLLVVATEIGSTRVEIMVDLELNFGVFAK